MLNLVGAELPLASLVGTEPLLVLGFDRVYEYKDGAKTDTQVGIKFNVVETLNYEKFNIKVNGLLESPIALEKIQDKSKKVFATFKDAKAKVYRKQNGELDLSISASAIAEAKQTS